MLSTCQGRNLLCFKPFGYQFPSKRGHRCRLIAGSAKRRKVQTPPEPVVLQEQPREPVERDFFEGEGWEIFGKIVSYSVPVMLVLAVIVGAFAAGTYNEGATVFLDTPKNPDDTAKFFSVTDE